MRRVPTKWVYRFEEGEVAEIVRRREAGEATRAIARSFQVSFAVIDRVLRAAADGSASKWWAADAEVAP